MAWALGAGIVLAVLIVLVAWLIEPEPSESRRRHRDIDVTDLITPGELTDEERRSATTSPSGSTITLEDGAWVQVADADGHLAQQYSAERIDPMPDGWLEMTRPRAMMFLDDGRIVTMRGEHGLLDVPNKAISSGMLDGDVVIRLFVPSDGEPIEITKSEPEVIVRTQEASFDNELGEIRCSKAIRIDSQNASFEGIGLTMLLGKTGGTIERLVVDRATSPIRVLLPAEEGATEEPALVPAADVAGADPDNDVQEVANPPLFYRLELERNVRITRYDSDKASSPASTVRGDMLVAIFSLEGEGLDDTIARSDSPGSTTPLSRDAFLGAAALAQAAEETPAPQLIEIEYDGRLLMVPAESKDHPASVDDVILEIDGSEHPVELTDARSSATALCDQLRYRSAGDVAELLGSSSRPLEVDGPGLRLKGERFWFARSKGLGGLSGPGVMHLAGEEASSSAIAVEWKQRVDLRFTPGTEMLEKAVFEEDVHVEGDDFDLDAGGLEVRFATGRDADPDSVEQIVARGTSGKPVRAERKGELGVLVADSIDLKLAQDGEGRSIPDTMRAEGGVEARDSQQTLWAKVLDVEFAKDQTTIDAEDDSIQIEKLTASDGVEVLLEDGARIWADTLRGSGTRRELTLGSTDDSVVIVRGNVVTDHLRQVRFDDGTRSAKARGPGRFRYFDEPIVMPAEGRSVQPQLVDVRPSMEATWSDGMFYDDTANDDAGALELHGNVVVRNRPDELEENDLDADDLRVDFMERSQVPHIDSDGNLAGEDDRVAFSGSRDLRLLTARGNARLESRTWHDASHQGEPELFQISGDDVRYDARSGEGAVLGAGALLVNRLPTESADPVPDSIGISIGGDGTTRFSWKQGMRMRRQVATRYLVTMTEGVEILHAGIQPKDTLTLSADKLEVLIDRPLSEPGSANATELDLGGQAEILRVAADGRVFVRTPDQDVECEVFNYDASSQIARLSAREGRLVTILGKDAVAPVRAESITWDMRSGRMQITGARGGGGR